MILARIRTCGGWGKRIGRQKFNTGWKMKAGNRSERDIARSPQGRQVSRTSRARRGLIYDELYCHHLNPCVPIGAFIRKDIDLPKQSLCPKAGLQQAIRLAQGPRLFYPLPASSAHRHVTVATHAHATGGHGGLSLAAHRSAVVGDKSQVVPAAPANYSQHAHEQVPNDEVPGEA